MFNAKELFKERLAEHMKRLNRYLRYIFNGHFMIALLFIIITVAIYYQQWLADLSDSFPALFVSALLLGLVASYNPLQFLLKAPDQVFLIVKEVQLRSYFRYAFLYNYIVQLYIVLITYAALLPLYTHAQPLTTKSKYVSLLFIVLFIKAWNMMLNFRMIQIRSDRVRYVELIGRTLLTIFFLYTFMKGQYVVISAVLLFVYFFNSFRMTERRAGIAWDLLIANDEARLGSFYRFVQMFANVPYVMRNIKKRKLLASVLHSFATHEHEQTYRYLYRFTFLRNADYFPLFVRLTIIGCILIVFVPIIWLKVSLALLFVYMTMFQLVPLSYHHRTIYWLRLYPIEVAKRQKTFERFLLSLGLAQTFIFSFVFVVIFQFTSALITLVLCSAFIHIFSSVYVRKKIAQK